MVRRTAAVAGAIVVAGGLIGFLVQPKTSIPAHSESAAMVRAGDWVAAETIVPEGFGLDCPLASPGECVVYDQRETAAEGAISGVDAAAEDAGGAEGKPAGQPMFDVMTALSLSQINLEGLLRDPSSARYQGVWRVNVEADGKWMPAYCGRVSGRNGFGGHAAYARFVATPVMAAVDGHPGFEQFYREVCVDLPRVEFVAF